VARRHKHQGGEGVRAGEGRCSCSWRRGGLRGGHRRPKGALVVREDHGGEEGSTLVDDDHRRERLTMLGKEAEAAVIFGDSDGGFRRRRG
jgi:hypothetical protein